MRLGKPLDFFDGKAGRNNIKKKKIDSYLDENTTHKRNEFWSLTRQEITQHYVNIHIKLI